ncbi:E3 ubiquitin-protein ligase RING2-A-like protein [Willisornis vidua]|uniref:RING-type E3 ubiquitin transferase n=1 Tax=Willisornis vidua TaxID=1566151 RepID=A0ABQ9D8B0_9PASS|nr:E3 ubiquitin-protein ligase RING2-A-like protein [Willisornis vidua]
MVEEGLTEGNSCSPSASTSQMPQAAPPCGSECPICLDIIKDQVSVSWCRHTFCFSCILQWSCIKAVCPLCKEPFQYLFHKVGDNNYDVYYISFTSPDPGRRARRHSTERRRHRSRGRQRSSSSSRDRDTGRASARDRERSRSPRGQHSGHSRGQQAQGYDSSNSYSQQQSWAQDTSSDTSSDEDQAARSEQDAPVRLRSSERYQRRRHVSSREPRATRSRSRRRLRSSDGHRGR